MTEQHTRNFLKKMPPAILESIERSTLATWYLEDRKRQLKMQTQLILPIVVMSGFAPIMNLVVMRLAPMRGASGTKVLVMVGLIFLLNALPALFFIFMRKQMSAAMAPKGVNVSQGPLRAMAATNPAALVDLWMSQASFADVAASNLAFNFRRSPRWLLLAMPAFFMLVFSGMAFMMFVFVKNKGGPLWESAIAAPLFGSVMAQFMRGILSPEPLGVINTAQFCAIMHYRMKYLKVDPGARPGLGGYGWKLALASFSLIFVTILICFSPIPIVVSGLFVASAAYYFMRRTRAAAYRKLETFYPATIEWGQSRFGAFAQAADENLK